MIQVRNTSKTSQNVKLTCFCWYKATIFVKFRKKKQKLAISNAHHSISIFFKHISIKTLPLDWRNTSLFLVHITQLHLFKLNIHQSKTYLFVLTRRKFLVIWAHGIIMRCCRQEKNYGTALMMRCWDVSSSAFQCARKTMNVTLKISTVT